MKKRSAFTFITAIALTAGLTACGNSGGSGDNASPSASAPASTPAETSTPDPSMSMSGMDGMNMGTQDPSVAALDGSAGTIDGLEIQDPWTKAADSGMSATFGVVKNTTGKDITIVKAESAVSPMLELHETVMGANGQMQMRPKEGGFTIKAGESLELKPGGNHLMIMDLPKPLKAGEENTFTFISNDNKKFEFTAVVKDFAGANENYVP